MVRNNLLILICIKNEPSSDQPLTVKDDKNWFCGSDHFPAQENWHPND